MLERVAIVVQEFVPVHAVNRWTGCKLLYRFVMRGPWFDSCRAEITVNSYCRNSVKGCRKIAQHCYTGYGLTRERIFAFLRAMVLIAEMIPQFPFSANFVDIRHVRKLPNIKGQYV